MSNIETLLDRLGKEALACRELIREMHECQKDTKQVIKDLNAANKRAEEMALMLVVAAQKAVDQKVHDIVVSHIQDAARGVNDAMHDLMDRQSKKIEDEFDRVSELVMGNVALLNDVVDKRRELEKIWMDEDTERLERETESE